MTFFSNISTRFFNYVSPRKTLQRRDKPFKPPPSAPPQLVKEVDFLPRRDRDMSPESRMELWNTMTHSPSSDVDITLIPASAPESALASESDLEGDTLISELPSNKEEQYQKYEDDFGGSSDDEFDANADTLIVDDGRYMVQPHKVVDVDEELLRRQLESRRMCNAGWPEDSVFLYQKLAMRGHEPLFPIDWIDDFTSFPEDLFTANVDKAFIKPAFGSTHHAQLAISNICDLGAVVRDAWLTKARRRTPTFHIRRAIKNFTTWAMKDGNVRDTWHELPLFCTAAWHRKTAIHIGEEKMLRKLAGLYEKWQDTLRSRSFNEGSTSTPAVPTLYGVTTSHTIMAFVSYSPPTEESPARLRLIGTLDFGKGEADVWNSLAVAIFVIHCRNRMMQLADYLPELTCTVVEEDPDV